MGNRLLRRARKDAAEKHVIRVSRHMDALELLDRHENQARVPLEEPKFWGYRRMLILRKDIANRRDADRMLELLKVVQKVDECRRKDFKVWDRDSRRWLDWNHTPRTLEEREFLRLPDRLRCFFEPGWDRYRRRIYLIAEPWMFETRRHKLWITHRFVPDGALRRELAYWNDVWDKSLLHLYCKLRPPRRRAWKKFTRYDAHKQQIVRAIARQEINAALEVHASGKLSIERGKEVMGDAQAQV